MIVSQQLRLCVFRAQLRLRTFYFGDDFMGELRINGYTVAIYENGTVYAGNSTFWGKVIGYYGGGEIQDAHRITIAEYSSGTARALGSFGFSGSDLCCCSGTTIYEGGSSWNNQIGSFTGDAYGACAAATLYLSLHDSKERVGNHGRDVDGQSIGMVLGVILSFMLIAGIILIWPTLFEVGGWLSAVMIGTQVISHIIVGAMCIEKENESFFDILKTTCLFATIVSGVLTWIFSGTSIPMLFASFIIAFLASVGSGLIATIVIVLLRKKVYNDKLKEKQRIVELSKNYIPMTKTWICKCGAKNSSNYSMCKKCGEYRNTVEMSKVGENRIKDLEERMQDNSQIVAAEIARTGAWTCACGRTNMMYVSSCVCGKTKYKTKQADK